MIPRRKKPWSLGAQVATALVAILTSGACSIGSLPPTSTRAVPSRTPVGVNPSHVPSATTTPTLVPTLSASGAEALVVGLLETNGGCTLPCWWGFTPEGSWRDMRTFLASFATSVEQFPLPDQPGVDDYAFRFAVPEQVWPQDLLQIYHVRGDSLEIALLVNGEAPAYKVDEFLRRNGPPDEIRVRTFPEAFVRDGMLPFTLVFEYRSRGFLADYYDEGTVVGGEVRACFADGASNGVFIWPASSPRELMDIALLRMSPILPAEDIPFFLTPSDIPGADLAAWLENLSDPRGEQCIEVPVDIWSWPGPP